MKMESAVKGETRKKILDLAEALLLSHGYHGFSYQQISKVLGVRNAAIHYHFPHKTDLGVALIQRYRRRFARFTDSQQLLSGREQLERYFELSETYFAKDRQICPSGVLSTEFPRLPEIMQAEASAFIDEMRSWAVLIALKGRAEATMTYAGEAEAIGAVLFSTLQGALQLARIDENILVTVKNQIRAMLGINMAGLHEKADK
ncbi:TetR/AcrR family transcriptional regulator [Craterilacuibacter sinensis]|uniref:TetR family transcriptional regulator n=1 Tax=Craterilacuibacter sinensis TaxID=2686017 RepID=A0A845BNE0_9NEIS|nr:TetR/AcrR family transcriptional regulator [Craterilacuibacter sinensis]MXR37875.1 TetR family transcriptional regulator [Craterilacuibacter sinensis]